VERGEFTIKNLNVLKDFNTIYYITVPAQELNWGVLGTVLIWLGREGLVKTYSVYVLLDDYYYIFITKSLANENNFENRIVKMKFYKDKPEMVIYSSISYFDYLKDKIVKKEDLNFSGDLKEKLKSDSSEIMEFECKVIVNKAGLHKLKPLTNVGWRVGSEVDVWFFKNDEFVIEKGPVRRVNKLFNRGEAVALQFTKKQAEKFGLAGKKKVKCIKNLPKPGAVTIIV